MLQYGYPRRRKHLKMKRMAHHLAAVAAVSALLVLGPTLPVYYNSPIVHYVSQGSLVEYRLLVRTACESEVEGRTHPHLFAETPRKRSSLSIVNRSNYPPFVMLTQN